MAKAVYVLTGIVAVNLVLIAAMFVHAQNAEMCDTSERGLVIWDEQRERWTQIALPEEPTDLRPCKGMQSTELTIVPG